MLEELHLNPVWPNPSLSHAAPDHATPDHPTPDRAAPDHATPDHAASSPASTADLLTLASTHSTLLFRVAHSVLRNRAAAEDVVQETFLRVLRHQRTLPSIRELRPWLLRITWHLALDHRRRLHPEQLDDLFAGTLLSPGLSPEAALAQTRRLAQTLREIDRLPSAEREALLLAAAIETGPLPSHPDSSPPDPSPPGPSPPDRSHQDLDAPGSIAAALGKSPSATRALLFRARTRLRERLTRKGLLP